eukprot:g6078.t1
MQAYIFLAAFLAAASRVAGHPICWVGTRSPDLEKTYDFCPAPQDGACCTDAEEAQVQARFEAVGPLSDDCAEYYKQVECGQCHSYSGHLFADLGDELGVEDGMTMKLDFCEDLVDACSGEIDFPTYDGGGTTYCEKHTGDQAQDFFWSYPYEEPELFEPGLNEVFPDLDHEDDFPSTTLSMHQSPDGSMFWLAGKAGVIKKVDWHVDADEMDSISTVMDISDGEIFSSRKEEGLIDFAFGPLFGVPGYPDYFYVSYSVLLDGETLRRNRLSRFEYFPDSKADTRDSEEILITTTTKTTDIHASGWCGFKPSAYGDEEDFHDLYWSTGDGGPQLDLDDNGQDELNLLSAMIRISVPSDGSGYEIPSGNYGSLPDVLPEICAIGFRNLWRCGFDRENDDLWCGDVGHDKVEEIDIVECGKNYGWSRFEGSRCLDEREDRDGPCDGADRSGITFPEFEYCHPDYYDDIDEEQDFTDGVDICGDRSLTGLAVIGGYVYRGQKFADLLGGAYVFADNVNRNIYYLKLEDGEWKVGTIISDKTVKVIGFSEDINGELMLITESFNIYHLPCGDLCFAVERAPSTSVGTYLGCFRDAANSGRVMEFAASSDDMDAEACAELCSDGQLYFATQYGVECWCGDGSIDFSTLDEGVCDFPCSGNDSELCGGSFALMAYAHEDNDDVETTPAPTPAPSTPSPVTPATPSPTTPTTPSPVTVDAEFSYVGCFFDEKGNRLMTLVAADSPDMTTEACAQLCSGSSFFGTQYSDECWCTNEASPDFDGHGAGICESKCTGDSSQTCGGYDAISAYQYMDGNGGTPSPVEPPTPSPVTTTTPSPITPTTPSPVTVDAEFSYVGCFFDEKGNRLMTLVAADSPDMTIEACAQLCSGSSFFGTQHSDECWCTSEASPDFDGHGEGACDFPCTGDSSQTCGGYDAISAYQHLDGSGGTPPPVAPPTPSPVAVDAEFSYVGCFFDEKGNRLMTLVAADSPDMTTEACAQLCSGSSFFGTQYSDECWCTSEASPDFDGRGAGVCDFPCTGDSGQDCGGYDAISVYELVAGGANDEG